MKQLLGMLLAYQKRWINFENHCERNESLLSLILHYTYLLLKTGGLFQYFKSEIYFTIQSQKMHI